GGRVIGGSSRRRSNAGGSWRGFLTSRVTPHGYQGVVVAPAPGADRLRAVGPRQSGGSTVRGALDHRARRGTGVRLVAADRRDDRRGESGAARAEGRERRPAHGRDERQ